MTTNLPAGASWWLSYGERGMSSEAMFYWLAFRASHSTAVPLDTHDLRRCRLMLEAIPELKAEVPKMADLSHTWAVIVAVWDDLCKMMDHEVPDWRKTPGWGAGTYQRLNVLIAQAIEEKRR